MANTIRRFLREEDGQDLVEYTLIIAVVTLGTIGLIKAEVPAVSNVWTPTNNLVNTAVVAVS